MLSLIMPVLDEAKNIVSTLNHLTQSIASKNNIEIIIVDGGSQDNTLQLTNNFIEKSSFNIISMSSEKGRAKQMNAGAKKATGSILYFLHADSYPPINFDTLIIQEVKKGNPAGCFKMKFDSTHWWLRLAGWLTQFSWRACRGGDQSQFVTRALFNEIGGYDESFVIYEDNILITELFARKKFVIIQEWIQSSARMYNEKGIWFVQYHFLRIHIKRWFGADAEELLAHYNKYIKQAGVPNVSEEKPVIVENVFANK